MYLHHISPASRYTSAWNKDVLGQVEWDEGFDASAAAVQVARVGVRVGVRVRVRVRVRVGVLGVGLGS
jgi:hypothetical protein